MIPSSLGPGVTNNDLRHPLFTAPSMWELFVCGWALFIDATCRFCDTTATATWAKNVGMDQRLIEAQRRDLLPLLRDIGTCLEATKIPKKVKVV